MTGKGKILVIEDDPGVMMLMVSRLTQAGCDVEAAWDAQTGMEKALADDFDLITLDVNLLGISDFEICRRLRENPFFQTPIVFISNRSSKHYVQNGLELGAVDYIIKPFDAQDFVSRILSYVSDNVASGLVEAIPESSMA
jgi:two-component system alkaline phosphatase synthesis response regulator PhoP